MGVCRKQYGGYSKMDKEDPEDAIHRRAQFLIYKVLEKADSRRAKPSSCLRIRICKLKVKIGNRFRRLRRRLVSAVRLGFQLKAWKRLLAGRPQNHLVPIPHPLIK